MSSNPTSLLAVSADGLARYDEYVNIFREYTGQLAGHGVEYEESDRRADPYSATLFVVLTTAVLTTAVSETVKVIFQRVSKVAKEKATPPTIQVIINNIRFILPQDYQDLLSEVDSLKSDDKTPE